MSYRFELNILDGRRIQSIVNTYRDPETAMTVGSEIAARLIDQQAGEPAIRPELRAIYPQVAIDVLVIDSQTDEIVNTASVTQPGHLIEDQGI